MFENIYRKKDVLNEYRCNGDFHFENDEIINLNFIVIQYMDGEIQLNADLNDKQYEQLSILFNDNVFGCSINGKLMDNNGDIKINKLYLNNISKNANFIIFSKIILTFDDDVPHNHIEFGVTNFFNSPTVFNDFKKFECSLDNCNIKFEGISKYKDYEHGLKENIIKSAITSKATVFTQEECTKEFEKLTYFLSYVNRTPIDFIYESYYSNTKLLKTVLFKPPIKNFSNNAKLIETEDLKDFIEKYFGNFSKYYDDFSLNIVITIFNQGLSAVFSDIGYVLLEISLETFLTEYECYCNSKNVEISINSRKQIKNRLCKFLTEYTVDVLKEDLDSLVEDISPEFTSVSDKFNHLKKSSMFKKNLKHKKGDDYFQTIRNKIAHTGKFPQTIHKDKRPVDIGEEFERLVYLIDRIILTLIGFEGSFSNLNGVSVEL